MPHPQPRGKGAVDLHPEPVVLHHLLQPAQERLQVPLGGLVLGQAVPLEGDDLLGERARDVQLGLEGVVLGLALDLVGVKEQVGPAEELVELRLIVDMLEDEELLLLEGEELPDLVLDFAVVGQGLFGVVVDGLLLVVLDGAVAAPGQQQADDLGRDLAHLELELLDCVVEAGVAGVGDLPVGVGAGLQQQLNQLELAPADGRGEEGLVAGLPVDLPSGLPTMEGCLASSRRRMPSLSSLLLFSTA